MNLQARLEKYRERDFQQSDAEILVLIEESAIALFTSFPDHFILFGGATLVLFYASPRASRDLDLLPSGALANTEDVQAVVAPGFSPLRIFSASVSLSSGRKSQNQILLNTGCSPI